MPNDDNKIILEFPATNVEIELGETITFDNISGFLDSERVTYNGDSLTEIITHLEDDKADTTYVNTELAKKADKSNTYTKTQVDDKLSEKANASDVYTKSQTDNLLNGKANASDVYTKQTIDALLNDKADVTDLPDMSQYYDKGEVDDLLDDKANSDDVYGKAYIDTALSGKANVGTSYTKSEEDALLANKADKSDTYTKAQVDDIVSDAIYNVLPDDTASGSVANFETDLALPTKSLKVNVDPIQDLNGYGSAWVAGAGKNKLPPNETDGSTTINGVTFTASNGVYKIVGLATDTSTITFSLKNSVDMSPSTQKIAFLNNKSASGVSLYFCRNGSSIHYWQMNPANRIVSGWTDSGNEIINEIRISVMAGTSVDLTISPMFLLLTESEETTFNPYENICPIEGWSEISLVKTGYNLFDISTKTDGKALKWSDGDTLNDALSIVSDFIVVKEGYKIISNYIAQWCCYDKNKNYLGNILSNALIKTSGADRADNTIPSGYGICYLRLGYRSALNNNEDMTEKTDIMLNIGNTVMPFEPYAGNEYIINLGGTYYGGHFTQDKAGHRQFEVTHIAFDDWANKNVKLYGINTHGIANFYLDHFSQLTKANVGICNLLTKQTSLYSETTDEGFLVNPSTQYIRVLSTRASTIEEFKTWADNNDLMIINELATPIVIDLPDGEPIATLIGTNNIFADTGDTSVVFKDSVNGYVEKKIASVQALALNT